MRMTGGLPTRATATLSLRWLPPEYEEHILHCAGDSCERPENSFGYGIGNSAALHTLQRG